MAAGRAAITALDEAVLQCLAPDGVFVSRGREITGHDALRNWYLGNMRRNAFSYHIPYLCLVEIEPARSG